MIYQIEKEFYFINQKLNFQNKNSSANLFNLIILVSISHRCHQLVCSRVFSLVFISGARIFDEEDSAPTPFLTMRDDQFSVTTLKKFWMLRVERLSPLRLSLMSSLPIIFFHKLCIGLTKIRHIEFIIQSKTSMRCSGMRKNEEF
jgi:hypothetical protein